MTKKATIVVKAGFLDSAGEPKDGINLINEVKRVEGISLLMAASASAIRVEGSEAALKNLKRKIGSFCAFSTAKPFEQYIQRTR